MNNLTTEQINALDEIKDGADIYSSELAHILRKMEQTHPKLLDITKPPIYKGNGTDPIAYFSAFATPAGQVVLVAYKNKKAE